MGACWSGYCRRCCYCDIFVCCEMKKFVVINRFMVIIFSAVLVSVVYSTSVGGTCFSIGQLSASYLILVYDIFSEIIMIGFGYK